MTTPDASLSQEDYWQRFSITPSILGSNFCHVPPGGTDGQVLAKVSDADFDIAWETLTAAGVVPDEIFVGATPPTDPTTEIWVDTSTTPPIVKWNNGGTWEAVSAAPASEVAVTDVDPYVTNTAATDELWFDTTASALKVRVAGVWQLTTPVADEVFVGPDAPPAPEAELWIDTDTIVRSTRADRLSVEVAQLRAEVALLRSLFESFRGGR